MTKIFSLAGLALFLFTLSSCAIAGGIFKAGVWVGILVVVGIIGLIIFLVTRGSNKN
ncbi:MAG: phosphatidate cytidylyltransferase [Bacteroidota bacterium]